MDSWRNVVTRLTPYGATKPMFADGWGRPILLDENYGEAGCGPNPDPNGWDVIESAGESGIPNVYSLHAHVRRLRPTVSC